jgi:2-keto-3-deoxy-L-rhamnonate aldolase RhmA
MSGSYGITGQTGHQIIQDACVKVADACRKYKKAAGQHIVTPNQDNVKKAVQQGYTFIALGMDSYFLQQGAKSALEMVK